MGTTTYLLKALGLLMAATTTTTLAEEKAQSHPKFMDDANVSPSEVRQVLIYRSTPFFEVRCNVEGHPKPTVIWTKDGRQLADRSSWFYHFRDGNQTLYLEPLTFYALGTYSCKAQNDVGSVAGSLRLDLGHSLQGFGDFVSKNLGWIVIVTGLVVGLSLAFCYVRRYRAPTSHEYFTHQIIKTFFTGRPDLINPDISLVRQIELMPYLRSCEIARSRITLGLQIGKGAFGSIYKAKVSSSRSPEMSLDVTLKMYDGKARAEEIFKLECELKTLSYLGRHLNIVNLVGASTSNLEEDSELWLLLEACKYGNLQRFVRGRRHSFGQQENPDSSVEPSADFMKVSVPEDIPLCSSSQEPLHAENHSTSKPDSCAQGASSPAPEDHHREGGGTPRDSDSVIIPGVTAPFGVSDLVCWAWQVARAMDFLTKRKVIHGQLALKNIFLGRGNVVKVANFGFPRPYYFKQFYKKADDFSTLRWISLESVRERIYSTQGDIWSFGILLWELFSLGENPYPDIETIDQEFFNLLETGYRMGIPQYANNDIYSIMKECWHVKPTERPGFEAISDRLAHMLPPQLIEDYKKKNATHEDYNKRKFEGRKDPLMSLPAPDYEPPEDAQPPARITLVGMNFIEEGDSISIKGLETVTYQQEKGEEQERPQTTEEQEKRESPN